MNLLPGQTLQLNRRQWTLRHVQQTGAQYYLLEAIGASEASLGMTRQMEAILLGADLFVAQRRGGYWYAHLHSHWQPGDYGPVLHFKPATALDLLDAYTRTPTADDFANLFSWSYSRDALYRRCPRAYYYHYYAAWEGWQPESPLPVQRTYLLKNLTSIPQWIGTVVHDAIKFALSRLQQGVIISPNELISSMRHRARADVEASNQGLYRQHPKKQPGFQEHYYQLGLIDSAWAAAWQQAEQRLLTFLHSSLYAGLQALPRELFLKVESLQWFELAGTKVWIQMDLATHEEGHIVLYDWKTGEVDLTEAKQQLSIYGLFVRHNWPEYNHLPIRGVVFNLRDDDVQLFELSTPKLQKAEATVQQRIRHLQKLLVDPAANLAELRRFPMINDRRVCSTCRFKELCNRAN